MKNVFKSLVIAVLILLLNSGCASLFHEKERLAMGSESEMVTIYHPDGDRLMMTHYCSAHNQPRMRSQSVSTEIKNITFDLVDVTNLSAPDAGHMKKLVVTFADRDHFTQEWTWAQNGKERTEVIKFERIR